MGGQEGGRGYLIQSLICVLDMLQDERWEFAKIEPDIESEKVDILWIYPNRNARLVQVKSSQNQISVPMVKQWAEDMRKTDIAGEYELRLIGPCSQGVLDLASHLDVEIPRPQSLDIPALIERAAHRLDSYLQARGIMRVPPFVRELLIEALVTRVSTYSTDGRDILRRELDDQFTRWVLQSYPPSVSKAVEMQCVALWDEVWIPRQSKRGTHYTKIIIDMTLLSESVRICLIRALRLVVSSGDRRSLFLPSYSIDVKSLTQMQLPLQTAFYLRRCGELALRKGRPRRIPLLFEPYFGAPWSPCEWSLGAYRLQLYAILADRETPVLLKDDYINITPEDITGMSQSWDVRASFRRVDFAFQLGEPDSEAGQ